MIKFLNNDYAYNTTSRKLNFSEVLGFRQWTHIGGDTPFTQDGAKH